MVQVANYVSNYRAKHQILTKVNSQHSQGSPLLLTPLGNPSMSPHLCLNMNLPLFLALQHCESHYKTSLMVKLYLASNGTALSASGVLSVQHWWHYEVLERRGQQWIDVQIADQPRYRLNHKLLEPMTTCRYEHPIPSCINKVIFSPHPGQTIHILFHCRPTQPLMNNYPTVLFPFAFKTLSFPSNQATSSCTVSTCSYFSSSVW